MPQCQCGRFFTINNYDPNRGLDLCPECINASKGYSYVNREYVGQDVTNNMGYEYNPEGQDN